MSRADRPAAKALHDAEVLGLRIRAQRLTAGSAVTGTPRDVLAAVCGVQAQLLPAAALAIRARSTGLTAAQITGALERDRTIIRGWLMRGTLHLVDAQDFGWLLSLLGPIFLRADARRRAQLGLGDEVVATGTRLIRRILAGGGALTRSEIVDRLDRRGLTLNARSQGPIHLIAAAALAGFLCLGPVRDREQTYVLIEDWLGPQSNPRQEFVLAELARRYFRAYGPATIGDLAAWSGVPIAMARSALHLIGAELAEVEVGGRTAWLPMGTRAQQPSSASRGSVVRLLPSFDIYLLGYATRALSTPPSLEARLQRGGGWIHPAIIRGGRAIGAWQLTERGPRAAITVEPYATLSSAVKAGIATEVRDIGRFLGRPVTLEPAV